MTRGDWGSQCLSRLTANLRLARIALAECYYLRPPGASQSECGKVWAGLVLGKLVCQSMYYLSVSVFVKSLRNCLCHQNFVLVTFIMYITIIFYIAKPNHLALQNQAILAVGHSDFSVISLNCYQLAC